MALFGRESESNTPPQPANPVRPPAARQGRKTTLIAAGATLIGEISGDTDVMIEGTVEGKVHPAQDVTVGEAGVVRGEISARNIRVAGRVQGNVSGKESVEILSTGSLEGDVASPGMVIGDGAFFKGRVEMTGHAQRPSSEGGPGGGAAQAPKPAKAEPPALGSARSPGSAG